MNNFHDDFGYKSAMSEESQFVNEKFYKMISVWPFRCAAFTCVNFAVVHWQFREL